MQIALATCRDLPEHEVDDRPLHGALIARGVTLAHPAWEDPAVDWSSFDACLIRTTWNYMGRPDDYLAWTRRVEDATRLFNPASVVAWNLRKTYLRDLERQGVRVIPTRWCESGGKVDVAAVMAEAGWSRGFVKPVVGATARETLRFDADRAGLAAAQTHVDRVLACEPLMIQPYQARVETDGELSAVFIDGAFSHGVRKVPVAGDYRVQDDFGARDEPYPFTVDELALARAAVGCVDADLLYARVDFLRDETGALCLTELELVEPSLFLRHSPDAAERLADALLRRLDG